MDDQRQVFTDIKTGETFVSGGFGHDPLHSFDGKTFYQLKQCGFCGTDINYEMTVLDPHSGVELKIYVKRQGLVVYYDGRTLAASSATFDTSQPVVPLPTVRKCEYLFQNTADNSLVYVSADKYKYSYESFKLFVGRTGDPMNQIPVQDVERYRDGGTTYVRTALGTLFSPAGHRHDKSATWNGAKVVQLDPKAYTITETIEGVVTIISVAH